MTAPVVTLDVADLEALLVRIAPQIAKADHERVTALVGTLIEVTRLVRHQGTSIARLRRLLGQTSCEKTAKVLGANENAAATSTPEPGTPTDAPCDPEGGEPPSGSNATEAANDRGEAPKNRAKRRKGHGRIPASAYAGETIDVPHTKLHKGQECPACAHGTLYERGEPSCCVRVFGQAPLVALRWACETLRCSGCGHVFTAPLPEEAKGPKYSESAASMMTVLRYGMGMPLHRLEVMQRFLRVPVPASTQWHVALEHLPDVLPVYDVLVALAANAPLVQSDDTYVRILELMGKRRDKLVTSNALELPDRTGLFTTGIVAQIDTGPIALFASGRAHAGENLADLLDLRDSALAPPIHMSDGLDRNRPDAHEVQRSNCLAHGRRHVVDEVNHHPELCAHLLTEIQKVFAKEKACRREGLVGDARLAYHQRESGPVMAKLHAWIEGLFADKRVEPNSGLGGALRYLLTRWEPLTLFLRVADTPIDNNLTERSLKNAIRQRRASLFYRSTHGARVGDIYTALIVTTQLHRGDPFRYLTALFTHAKAVAASPRDWLPWNYDAALARLDPPHTAAA